MRVFALSLLFLFCAINYVAFSQTYCISGSSVNLRSNPRIEDGNVIAKLQYGTPVTVIENDNNGWTKIRSLVFEGYVATKYLSDCGDKANPPKSSSVGTNYKNSSRNTKKVIICNSSSAYAYHSYECRGLARCRSSVSWVTVSEAESMGRVPCKICY